MSNRKFQQQHDVPFVPSESTVLFGSKGEEPFPLGKQLYFSFCAAAGVTQRAADACWHQWHDLTSRGWTKEEWEKAAMLLLLSHGVKL